jgi:uncharacterized delta-60 repeat protein
MDRWIWSLVTGFREFSVIVQNDGKVVVAGDFTDVNGSSRGRIARLNSDGTVDGTFGNGLAGANGRVYAIGLQSDGKLVIGGDFTFVNGRVVNRLARLNPDGTLDTGFGIGQGVDNAVRSIVVQSDGKVLIGGAFVSVNNAGRNRIALLNPDGSLDGGFAPLGPDSVVLSVARARDRGVLIGGAFTNVNGIPAKYFARLWGHAPSYIEKLSQVHDGSARLT